MPRARVDPGYSLCSALTHVEDRLLKRKRCSYFPGKPLPSIDEFVAVCVCALCGPGRTEEHRATLLTLQIKKAISSGVFFP